MTDQGASPPGLLRLLFLSGVSLAGLMTTGVLAWHYFQDPQAIADGIARARPWLVVWRVALFALLIGLWPQLINSLADRHRWNDTQRQFLRAQRWRIAGWLIVIELLLVQNLFGKFVSGLVS